MRSNSNDAELATACRIIANEGLTEMFTGHVSLRSGDSVRIPSDRHEEGAGLESTDPSDVISIDLDRTPGATDGDEPPSEFVIHTEIYKARPGVNSVVHCHPTYAKALSMADATLEPASFEARQFGGPVPTYDPGPKLIHELETGAGLADALGESMAVLVRGHGAVTVGSSIGKAVSRMYLLERAAELQCLAESFGPVRPFDPSLTGAGYLTEGSDALYERLYRWLTHRVESA